MKNKTMYLIVYDEFTDIWDSAKYVEGAYVNKELADYMRDKLSIEYDAKQKLSEKKYNDWVNDINRNEDKDEDEYEDDVEDEYVELPLNYRVYRIEEVTLFNSIH